MISAGSQPVLDAPSLVGQIAAPVTGDVDPLAEFPFQFALEIGQQHLDIQPEVGEDDRLDFMAQKQSPPDGLPR